jgi:hypothetical protein
VTGLTKGKTYAFRVQARNSYGLSDPSSVLSVLAAQIPAIPSAPTTTVSGTNVIVRWTAPDNGGSVITAYSILIRQNDGGFSPVLTTCNGATATIVQNLQCTIANTVLVAAPFNIPWNTQVFATVSATNVYGTSAASSVGGGAIIVTVPNPPLNLQNNPSLTTST